VLLTAHQAPGSEAANWAKLAGSGATLVIYMPGQNYSEVATKLKAAGLTANTPCAVISRATTRYERIHATTIAELPHTTQLAAPTLLVVGEVVRFADPVALAQAFVIPTISAGREAGIPSTLFADAVKPTEELGTTDFRTTDFRTDEEPFA
jgi:hypothetical protein